MFRFVVIPHHMNMKRHNNIVCGMRRMGYENHKRRNKNRFEEDAKRNIFVRNQ